MAEFAKRLRSLMDEEKVNQTKLAEEMDLSRTTVASWVSGHRTPELKHINWLARRFRVSVDYLLGLSDIRKPTVPEWFKELDTKWRERLTEDPEIGQILFRFLNRSTLSDLPAEDVKSILEHQASILERLRAKEEGDKE